MTLLRYYIFNNNNNDIIFQGRNSNSNYGMAVTIHMPSSTVVLGQYSSAIDNTNSIQYNQGAIGFVQEFNSSSTSVVILNVISYNASNHYAIQVTFSGKLVDAFGNSVTITNGNINAQLY